MNRNWLVSKTNPEFLKHLSQQTSISKVLAQVLVNRGMNNADLIKEFLDPSLSKIHDPFLMPDMSTAVERIKMAADRNETVFIHGDYDADGTTATALLISAFKKMGLKTSYHIPNRIIEGYGLSNKGIQSAKQSGAGLIITVDCGISSGKEVLAATSMGIDVIITDHHEPPEKLPDACAIIDPHRADSQYPFKQLAGVGVAFKLVQALIQKQYIQDISLEDCLDLVALGTIADSVPLVDENRIFVTHGLKAIASEQCRTGITAIKEVSGMVSDMKPGTLSYTLIPRINAAGRLDDAGEVVELFLTGDEAKAKGIALLLDDHNRQRQRIQREVLQSALDMINPDQIESAIVLSSADWHPGVIGIVASRLVDMFYRPVFLFSVKDSVAKGSARSIPPLHLYEAISESSEHLLNYGGHRQAAGLRLLEENLTAFKQKINAIVSEKLKPEDMVPLLEIDASIKFSDINFDLIRELSLLEPYGESNKPPVFGSKDIQIVNHRIVGNNHLKMQLKQESINMDTIGFNMGKELGLIEESSSIDIVFKPSINEWNGMKNLQCNLKAVRPSS
jgi:single-stranded-DNA-specific exonuclease